MKILLVQKVKAFAGSEKYLTELIPELTKRGYSCKLVCVIEQKDLCKLKHFEQVLQDKCIEYNFVIVTKNLSIGLLRKLNKIAKKDKYDLVHLHLIHAELWFALIKTFFGLKTKLVSTVHGFDETFQAEHGFDSSKVTNTKYVRILRFNQKKIANYFAVSKGLKDLMVEGGIIPENKIRVINLGFNYPDINQLKREESKLKTILVPGRIVPYKGQNLVIEMLPKLHDLGVSAQILIAGDAQGNFAQKLKNQVKELQIENNVQFLGHVSNIDDYFQQSDLVILSSKAEGFGLVLLEAFNHLKPVITFNVPAFNTTIKDGKTGLLTPCFDTEKLANNAAKLLTDHTFAQKLAKNAKQDLLSYYCLDRMVTETVAFYEDSNC
ncbi:MAG: glycosyltransferase family 4 protein [Crocinitomicaceae bacterium]